VFLHEVIACIRIRDRDTREMLNQKETQSICSLSLPTRVRNKPLRPVKKEMNSEMILNVASQNGKMIIIGA